MKTAAVFSLISIFACAPLVAMAEVKPDLDKVDRELEQCLSKEENLNTMGMRMCVGLAYEAADKVLNKTYQGIVKDLKAKTGDPDTDRLNAETLRRLVRAERAWIPFRDAQASLQGIEMLGGSGEPQIVTGTLYDLTKKRALELDELFVGGDI